jgi:hypothetical protein
MTYRTGPSSRRLLESERGFVGEADFRTGHRDGGQFSPGDWDGTNVDPSDHQHTYQIGLTPQRTPEATHIETGQRAPDDAERVWRHRILMHPEGLLATHQHAADIASR